MKAATARTALSWWPAAASVAGLALLIGYTLREVLAPGNDRLPGIDAGNLYTWEIFTRSALSSGRLPHWNPYHLAGTPHLADPMTTVLYPPGLLLRWLPPVAFLSWMTALHLLIAGTGALMLARVAGMRWLAAAACAIAVVFGGSVGAWIHNGHLLLLQSTAWLPWVLALAIVSVRQGRRLPHPALVIVLVLHYLAGYLQGSVYVAAAAASYFVFSALWPDGASATRARWRPLVQLAALALLAGGLSAVQLLPTLTLIGEAGRTSGLDYEVAVEGGWAFRDLVTIFFPFYGLEASPPHRYLSDRLVYVGWLLACAVPFACFDRARRRLAIFFGVLAIVPVALALGDTLGAYRLHYALFPGLRVPGRLLFIATLSLAVLGGIGLEQFLTLTQLRRWRAMAGGVVLAALPVGVATAFAMNSDLPPMHAWPWLPVVAAAGLTVMAIAARVAGPRPALIVAVALVVLDITTFSVGAVTTVPVTTAREARQWLGPPREGRMLTVCENHIGPGEFLLNGEPTVDGLAGIHLRHYADWAYLTKFGQAPQGDGLFRRIGSEGGLLPARRDLVDLANVAGVLSCEPLDAPALSLVHSHESFLVYRNERAQPRAFWTCGVEGFSRQAAIARLLRGRYDRDGRLLPRHYMNARWAPHVTDEMRKPLETRHQLVEGVRQEGRTWRYVLEDRSHENIMAMLLSTDIEDTHGVDRKTGALVVPPGAAVDDAHDNAGEAREEWLIGTRPCAQRGDVRIATTDQVGGDVVADVSAGTDGVVFFSEPYYSERRAFVDGEAVTPLRANLAFVAVPVAAGRHRVELRMVPRSFHAGLAVTGLTLAGWLGALFLTRR